MQSGSGAPSAIDTVIHQAGDVAIHLEVTDTNGLRGFSNTITVHVAHCPSDFDFDGDVDMKDFAHLQLCFTGPAAVVTDPACCALSRSTLASSVSRMSTTTLCALLAATPVLKDSSPRLFVSL